MPLVSLRQLLDHAAERDYGVPAFNVNNMEQIHAIMQAADACDAPVILQASAGVRKYDIRLAMTGAMRRTMAEQPEEFHPRAFLKGATAVGADGTALRERRRASAARRVKAR